MGNPILKTDSYKSSHFSQIPPEIKYVSSYIEARGGGYDRILFNGLQGFLKTSGLLNQHLSWPKINKAEKTFTEHGEPFSGAWMDLLRMNFPIQIRALPEGMIVPPQTPLLEIRNTDPRFPWLPQYIETQLLRAIWYPTTVGSRSNKIRQIIKKAMMQSCDTLNGLSFKLHDFGARGVSSSESAAIGGTAHLLNFMGTDTTESIEYAQEAYNSPMAGFSIPAMEHSTVTSWCRNREVDAYRNFLNKFGGPGKLIAAVSDSYNIYHAVSHIWGKELKEEVINSGTKVVIRPDSGIPEVMVVEVLRMLEESYGVSKNTKGYNFLNPAVGVIQGDGIDEHSIQKIIDAVHADKFSMDNVGFGMGGQLLQGLNRDTSKFAMKASAVSKDGISWIPIGKDPVTDSGKKQKMGLIDDPRFETVYLNGKSFLDSTLESIRQKVWNQDIA